MSTVRRTAAITFSIVVATLCTVMSAAWACTQIAAIKSSHSSNPAGSALVITGTDFHPTGDVYGMVEIRWNAIPGEVLGTAPGPNFTVEVTVPADAKAGSYYIYAVQRTADGVVAGRSVAPFKVTAVTASSPPVSDPAVTPAAAEPETGSAGPSNAAEAGPAAAGTPPPPAGDPVTSFAGTAPSTGAATAGPAPVPARAGAPAAPAHAGASKGARPGTAAPAPPADGPVAGGPSPAAGEEVAPPPPAVAGDPATVDPGPAASPEPAGTASRPARLATPSLVSRPSLATSSGLPGPALRVRMMLVGLVVLMVCFFVVRICRRKVSSARRGSAAKRDVAAGRLALLGEEDPLFAGQGGMSADAPSTMMAAATTTGLAGSAPGADAAVWATVSPRRPLHGRRRCGRQRRHYADAVACRSPGTTPNEGRQALHLRRDWSYLRGRAVTESPAGSWRMRRCR